VRLCCRADVIIAKKTTTQRDIETRDAIVVVVVVEIGENVVVVTWVSLSNRRRSHHRP